MYVGSIDIWKILKDEKSEVIDGIVARIINKSNAILRPGWPIGLDTRMQSYKSPSISLKSIDLRDEFLLGDYYDNQKVLSINVNSNIELAAYRLWNLRDSNFISLNDILDSSFILSGLRHIRGFESRTTKFSCGQSTEFLYKSEIDGRMRGLISKINHCPIRSPLLAAIAVYLDVLLIHPLPDGNGRLARLLFQTMLHIQGGLKAPTLPIASVINVNRACLLDCYGAIERCEKTEPIIEFFLKALVITSSVRDKIIEA